LADFIKKALQIALFWQEQLPKQAVFGKYACQNGVLSVINLIFSLKGMFYYMIKYVIKRNISLDKRYTI
jgi:hypothetical protein